MNTFTKVVTFVMSGGERYSLLVDESTKLPLYYPNLFITTQIRNKSLSLSSMNSALAGIKVLLHHLGKQNDSLEKRFMAKRFFNEPELDGLRDTCQERMGASEADKTAISSLAAINKADSLVSKDTEYIRLTVIADYIEWLAQTLLIDNADKQVKVEIRRMSTGLKARRPPRKRRNLVSDVKGLTAEQIEVAFEVFRPASPDNPFVDQNVRKRNRLIFLLLYHLGLRGGELLNIRIRDFDFQKNQLFIPRRADQPDDPRTYQPLVKTMDRVLPIKDTLIKEIHSYILEGRKIIPNAKKHDYLLVTHKSGPSQGQPLSIPGYKRVINVVKQAAPDLYKFTGHQLRHTWNDNFSRMMDAMDEQPSAERQEQIRSYLMGWREGSGTAATYNKRFIVEQANEAALGLQDKISRLPEEKSNDRE